DEADRPARRDEDVLWRDRAVDDAVSVRDLQRVEDLLGNAENGGFVEVFALDGLREGLRFDPASHDERRAIRVGAVCTDGDHARVVEAVRRIRAAHEEHARALVLCDVADHDLQDGALAAVTWALYRLVRRCDVPGAEEPQETPAL